jgi:hypothetical protein
MLDTEISSNLVIIRGQLRIQCINRLFNILSADYLIEFEDGRVEVSTGQPPIPSNRPPQKFDI